MTGAVDAVDVLSYVVGGGTPWGVSRQWWWWAITVAGVVIVAGGLAGWRRVVRGRGVAAGALWLEIVPAARMSELAAVGFARLLVAGLSGVTDRGGSRVSLEMWAEADQTRIGVWVPGPGAARGVWAAVRDALPGALVRVARPPGLGRGGVRGWQLSPRGGVWAVLIEPGRTGGSARRPASTVGVGSRAGGEGPDPLGAVFAAVNDCAGRRCTGAGVQVVITGAGCPGGAFPGFSLAGDGVVTTVMDTLGVLARDTARWGVRAAAVFLTEVVFGLVEVLLPGPGSSSSRSRARGAGPGAGRAGVSGGAGGLARYAPPEHAGAAVWAGDGAVGGMDPVVALGARARVAKRAAGPHARVSVRVVACGVSDRAARALAWEVATGYSLAVAQAQFRPSRLRRCARVVGQRHPSRFFWVTVEELAALWHVPVNAAEFGLPEAAARTRPGGRGVPRPRAGEVSRYLPPFTAPITATGRGENPAGGHHWRQNR